jgi:osmoprotectant transport system ATP-binding protein
VSGAALTFSQATARYPDADRDAVRDVSMRIEPGEFIALVGPSGCGKSTLLRTVNRLVPLVRGDIDIDGTSIAALDPVALRRTIGYAIQAVGLFSHMSVAENIAIVPTLLGWTRERIAQRVDALLSLVRLDPERYRGRRPRELSGGEAQRVGVARAIAAEPRVLLMDEPFGALDAIVRRELQDELRRIVHELDTTTLFVTHDVDEALRLAHRIAVMRDGELQQLAKPLELLVRPANAFVGELVRSDDAIRRLSIMTASDAMRSYDGPVNGTAVRPDRDLYGVLSLLLDGSPRIVVVDGDRALGAVDFASIQAAVGEARS